VQFWLNLGVSRPASLLSGSGALHVIAASVERAIKMSLSFPMLPLSVS
jgi:hypothetical protein